MNKFGYVICVLVFAFLSQPLWAAHSKPVEDDEIESDTPTPTPVIKPVATPISEAMLITISASPFIGIPISGNMANEYNVGGGGEVYISYPLEKRFLIGLDIGVQDYTVNTNYYATVYQKTYGTPLPSGVVITGDFTYVPFIMMAKYYFHENGVGPYALWGLGAAVNSGMTSISYNNQSSSISAHESDFLMVMGFGISFRAGNNIDLFLQGRVDTIFASNSDNDTIAITNPPGSVKGNLLDDSPTLFVPLQFGIRFL